MTKPNDGGPAFPRAGDQVNLPVKGMTLRQWYAGQALAGFCAEPYTEEVVYERSIAERSCDLADALIDELDKE